VIFVIEIYESKAIRTFLEKYENRRLEISKEVSRTVQAILEDVKHRGDKAVTEYTARFDGADLNAVGLKVTEEEFEAAVKQVPEKLLDIFRRAAANIRKYHESEIRYGGKGKAESWISKEKNGIILGQRVTPIYRVGIYVPGGRAAYPSSLLMAAIPAQVAGVKEIIAVTPPGKDGKILPAVLAAARIADVREIYRIGGAQAVAAMTFGTESIRPVDKIVGPGNLWVAEAKRQVFGVVDIDMVAGPSEVVILADEKANPDFIAADLLAQAEHDPAAASICITASREIADRTKIAVTRQAETLSRKTILKESLNHWGAILLVRDMAEGTELVNALAPEHLGLHTEHPWKTLEAIQNAGAIFLGSYSPESAGDYWAGPNHILPTNRTSRFSSPLGTWDFLKRSSIIYYPEKGLKKNADAIMTFAKTEGLDGHANAVQQRIS
jgi:histidinol dehydrogenase